MDQRALQELCHLARLELSDAERVQFAEKFERLLTFVDAVQAYQPQAAAQDADAPVLELRTDKPRDFEWPQGWRHDYRAAQVIDFEGDS